jgi:leucyl-tRNA synthetase
VTQERTAPYDFAAIEEKWRDYWSERGFFRIDTSARGDTFYYLNMFPYPSGYLHVGHGRNYIIGDVITRVKTMRGYTVLNPMGWDAFGLPAENAAIENNTHPREYTLSNIATSRQQFRAWGVQFDWDREVTTCLPDYYKWTQWLFLQLYKNGLAYRRKAKVNYCPHCKTVLANEQVVGGQCERCGTTPEPRELEQWFFKITDYADRLLADLDQLPEWPDNVRKMQENWIGRSAGAEVTFTTEDGDDIPVFTTRPDTLWGATFMVLAPEHPLVEKIATDKQRGAVVAYREQAIRETEIDRLSTEREKTGVHTGAYAINPVNGARIPIWIADYVLMTYGTGAIMAVPAHDERDFAFALRFGLPIVPVIDRPDGRTRAFVAHSAAAETLPPALSEAGISSVATERGWIIDPNRDQVDDSIRLIRANLKPGSWASIVGTRFAFVFSDATSELDSVGSDRAIVSRVGLLTGKPFAPRTAMEILHSIPEYEDLLFHAEYGEMRNSDPFTGTPGDQAVHTVTAWLEETAKGRQATNYRLHDWLISRQRYWGAPIPIVYCPSCGTVPVPEEQLPVVLPDVEFIGKMGLADIPGFADTTCPNCGGSAQRDTDTMDTFVDSSWYYLRFISPQDDTRAFGRADVDRWLPVDQYVGGVEHAILHLLYARFVTKALHDLGHVGFQEPFSRLFTQGMICYPAFRCPEHGWLRPENVGDPPTCPHCGKHPSGGVIKMSKSKRNVVDPTDIIERYGADTERLYTLFMGPPDRDIEWTEEGIRGSFRFVNRVWALVLANADALASIDSGVRSEPGSLDDASLSLRRSYHRTVKKVTEDLDERFSFNTAIAAIMELTNELIRYVEADINPNLLREVIDGLILLLSPMAPFLCEELWRQVGHESAILDQAWPTYLEEALAEETVEVPVQINGKLRARILVPAASASDPEKLTAAALADEAVAKRLEGKDLVKAIAIPGKMVSLVVR